MRWQRDGYEIDTDRDRLDRPGIRAFLATSYWAQEVPQAVVDASCAGSLCFGLYAREAEREAHARSGCGAQVGFARVITDGSTFGYLADVFVLEAHRRRGLSKWLVACVLEHPDLQGLRRFLLATRDAHGLYERFGFRPLAAPEKMMEIARPGLYLTGAGVPGATPA